MLTVEEAKHLIKVHIDLLSHAVVEDDNINYPTLMLEAIYELCPGHKAEFKEWVRECDENPLCHKNCKNHTR